MATQVPLRVGIAGFGTIGKVVAQYLNRGIDGVALAAVSARDIGRAERAMADFARPVPVLPLAGWPRPISTSSSNAPRRRCCATSPSRRWRRAAC